MNSASALIIWKDKILLFHRDNIPTIPNPDCWSLPGGIVEKGETPLQGITRELQEEVSYVPQILEPTGKLKNGNGTTHIYMSFIDGKEAAKFKHGPGEGQEIGFFTLEEALKLKLSPKLKYYFLKLEVQIEKKRTIKGALKVFN